MRPKAACASSAIFWMLASSRTSSSRPCTLRPSARISSAKGVGVLLLAGGDDEVGAGQGQRAREVLPEAAAGAGHQGHAARQIEKVLHHGRAASEPD